MRGFGYVALLLVLIGFWFIWQVLRRVSAGVQAVVNPERYAITKVEKMLRQDASNVDEGRPEWKIAIEYFPDLVQLNLRLCSLSEQLASDFRTRLLKTKAFNERHDLARRIEEDFLIANFGRNQEIVDFGRRLMQSGNTAASADLRQTVAVLGDEFDAAAIIKRIQNKYPAAQVNKPNVEAARDMAMRLAQTGCLEDAEALVLAIGGQILERQLDSLRLSSHTVYILRLGQTQHTFNSLYELTQWIIKEIVTKLLAQEKPKQPDDDVMPLSNWRLEFIGKSPPTIELSRIYEFSNVTPHNTIATLRLVCILKSLGLTESNQREMSFVRFHRQLQFHLSPFQLSHPTEFTMQLFPAVESQGEAFHVLARPLEGAPNTAVIVEYRGKDDVAQCINVIMSGKDMVFRLADERETLVKFRLQNDVEFRRVYDEADKQLFRSEFASEAWKEMNGLDNNLKGDFVIRQDAEGRYIVVPRPSNETSRP